MARPSLHKTHPRGAQAVTGRAREAHRLRRIEHWSIDRVAEHFGVSTHCISTWVEKVEQAIADERNLRALGLPASKAASR